MRKVKDKNLAELLLQLDFTPELKRLKQLDAAEALLQDVQTERDYPFDFVYFRITGFQPKEGIEYYLIPGNRLQEDLQAFIAKLSSKSPVPVELQKEKIYSVEGLAEHLGIATKTVHRWRKHGLVARKFVFSDGGRRLGFSQSAVDRFIESNPERLRKAGDFNRLSADQRKEIIDLAQMYDSLDKSRHQIIQAISKKTGRAHETIRYILVDFEKKYPRTPLFKRSSGVLDPSQAVRLYESYQEGTPISELMSHYHRSRSSIYRIINQRRAAALLSRRIRYVYSDEFAKPEACEIILQQTISVPRPQGDPLVEPFGLLGEQLVPEYLQILKDTPVLSHEQENILFRKYNCLKYMAVQQRGQLKLAHVSSKTLKEVEGFLKEAETIERWIVEANLRLVVSVASKHSFDSSNFAELVSKGNYALIKAVQGFDYTQGYRFGKRATLSIAKEYARVSGKDTELSKGRVATIANRQMQLRETADIAAIERTRQSLTQVIRNELDEREQYIIMNHFGLATKGIRKQFKTLKEIGDHLGLTKERVRQIELVSLQKLRQCLSSEEFELLTG